MSAKRSLGGIGALYRDLSQHESLDMSRDVGRDIKRDDGWVGKIYYNLKPAQPPGIIICTIVLMDNDVELLTDRSRYRVVFDDGQYLIVTLTKLRPVPHSPYVCFSTDGVFHPESSYPSRCSLGSLGSLGA